MRKVTEITVNALAEGKTKKLGNTEVCLGLSCFDYYLHDNLIAMYNPRKKELWISDAGRRTQVTKERLNGILRKFKLGRILQRDFQWYFSDNEGIHEWKGSKEFTNVENLLTYNFN